MGWEDWAQELEAWEMEAVVQGIVSSVKGFYQTGGGQLTIQVENNNPKKNIQPSTKDKQHNTEDNYNLFKQIAVSQNRKWKTKYEGLGL